MTICKKLAEKQLKNGKTVKAYECIDKYSSIPKYEISIVNVNGFEIETIHTSKTTWKKKFKELTR